MTTLRKCFVCAFMCALLWIPSSAATRPATKAPVRKVHNDKTLGLKKHSARDDGSFVGMASWYGIDHQGKAMANSEKFNRKRLTAAHRSLPLGTHCLVTFPKTGKSVVVTITDRGPAAHLHRILDLSEAAAVALGLRPYGIGEVIIQPLEVELEAPDPPELIPSEFAPFSPSSS